jgi:hypothetical protein
LYSLRLFPSLSNGFDFVFEYLGVEVDHLTWNPSKRFE